MTQTENLPGDKAHLLVDADKPIITRLGRAMEARGFAVRTADTDAVGLAEVRNRSTGQSVVSLCVAVGGWLAAMEA